MPQTQRLHPCRCKARYVPVAPEGGVAGGGKPLVPPLTPPPPGGGVGEVPTAPLETLNVVTMPICENNGSDVIRT